MRVKAYYASVYVTLGVGVHEQMFQSGGQSDMKTPSVKFPSKLGTHFIDPLKDERLSQPCQVRVLNLGPVVWKRNALTT
ncbi:hypothetical protein TNCV_4676961 [Trichonephila clavipes]|nr:hypothetical protein TNCV_4676961 [Trichonephila clavipes]